MKSTLTDHDQHDAAFKGVLEHVLPSTCVRTISGVEVAKFPLRVDLITERLCSLPQDGGLLARLINQLPPRIVFEFKGPTDTLKEQHIWKLLAYAALYAMERNLSLFTEGIAAVVVFAACSTNLRQLLAKTTVELSPGLLSYNKLITGDENVGLHLLFVDVQHLALSPENLPFLLFREQDIEQILDMILSNPETNRLYGYQLYKIQRKKIQKILQHKGIPMTEVASLRELIEDFGVKAVIDEVGLKTVIDEVGLKTVIDEVGLKTVIDEVDMASALELIQEAITTSTLTAKDIKYLKQLIVKIEEALDNKSRST